MSYRGTKWFLETLLFIYVASAAGNFTENGLNSFHERFKRQLDSQRCRKDQFFCKSGECIPVTQECNGAVNCKDGSDETSNCRRIKCPKYLFTCAYGACISKDLECDEKFDCRDGSDENTPNCSNVTLTVCAKNEFRCNSGQCIPGNQKCDGRAQCGDKSDETTTNCWNFKCPKYLYRCSYGACVDGNAECNGIIDCQDGSDEDNSKCQRGAVTTESAPTPTPAAIFTPKPISGSCILPQHPEHGQWKPVDNSNLNYRPGELISYGKALKVFCKPSYKLLKGANIIVCENNGEWSNPIGKCIRVCQPIKSTEILTVTCTLNGIPQSCDSAVDNTLARYKCANFYEDLSRKSIDICRDGSWDNTRPSCVPECGKKRPEAKPLVIDGANVTKGDFPWQVALYRTSDKVLICGGTLISQTVIISAAHCVTELKGETKPVQDFEVAVGKYYRPRDDPRDKTEAQFSTLKKIIVPSKYKGETQNYVGDIAILITNNRFNLSRRVQPICMDWGLNYQSDLYNPQKTDKGYVTGWGFTTELGKASEVLKQLEVPPVAIDTCTANIPENYEVYITEDKMCAGFYDKSAAVCSGDSGGGLVFKFGDGRYYLTGVVSLSPQAPTGGCDSQHVGLYTRIYSYLSFIYPHSL